MSIVMEREKMKQYVNHTTSQITLAQGILSALMCLTMHAQIDSQESQIDMWKLSNQVWTQYDKFCGFTECVSGEGSVYLTASVCNADCTWKILWKQTY